MIVVKGFNKGTTCTRGNGTYQYQAGQVFEEQQADARRTGFHAAENPLDCLTWYEDWEKSEYWRCELTGDLDDQEGMVVGTRIRLLAKLDKWDFAAEVVDYLCRRSTGAYGDYGWIRVKEEEGEAPAGGVVVVKGKSPRARGGAGCILALIREDHGETLASICRVDGKEVRENTWYGI